MIDSETVIVNIKDGDKFDVYIGRDKSRKFHYGNPFSHYPGVGIHVSSRYMAVESYRKWLSGTDHAWVEPERRLWILDNVHNLLGKRLGCFCHPLQCHGEVLVELIEKHCNE